jgi:hypothetical protein
MKKSLNEIIQRAWNEPRHFFFWLALLSLVGLIGSLVLGNAVLSQPNVPLAFAALGCALCFLVSLPAFVLAWIPPVRRGLAGLLRYRFFVALCLATMVALFYAVENWRGRRAWLEFKRTEEALGERFDLSAFVPPSVPADQNFFESPLWTDLRQVQTNRTGLGDNSLSGQRTILDIYGPEGRDAPRYGGWQEATPVDLAAWQAFYRGSNNLFTAANGALTNYFPVAASPQSPAKDVLLALSRFEPNRQILIETAQRPHGRFWVNYDAGIAALLPHLARMRGCATYLSLHATAALKAGDRQTALEDIRALLRITEYLRQEPFIISHLVRAAMVQIALQPVWEGLKDRQWTEADLVWLGEELGKLDFLADYHFAMRGERALSLWTIEYARKAGWQKLFSEGVPGGESAEPAPWEKSLGGALFHLVPSGWFDQNKYAICQLYRGCLLVAVDPKSRLVRPETVSQFTSLMERRLSRRSPYNIFSSRLLPALGGIARKNAQLQSYLDQARVACALERHRLANGRYPETLAALAPGFLDPVPHDLINGQPLRYRLVSEDQFLLYSVGWNRTDEGGKIELSKSGRADATKGDWVWRYPSH